MRQRVPLAVKVVDEPGTVEVWYIDIVWSANMSPVSSENDNGHLLFSIGQINSLIVSFIIFQRRVFND